ncbi:hypothetical protein LEP1GSC158_2208 [Leptospira interrogans serovar Zanoni str. LT2156]|uniref:Uncharacterized protein n=1 Tax=Leptospira interrogans serovar Zanoni str. LT2156 TaxID=1001601 RepID=M6HB20_LEPIR|nr:hypothetical protein LEP1GSC158_2208 [Leptospira interrogans serovar Zanoni str. LT2156]
MFFRESIQNFLSFPLDVKIELWLPEQSVLKQIQEEKNIKLEYYKLFNNSLVSRELNQIVAATKGDFVFFGILGFSLIIKAGSTNYYNMRSSLRLEQFHLSFSIKKGTRLFFVNSW